MTYSNRLAIEPKIITTGLSGDTVSAAANGTSFNRNTVELASAGGPYHEGVLVAQIEAITGTPDSIDVKFRIEHSDTDSNYVAVTDLAIVGTATLDFTAVGIAVLPFRVRGLKQYVRAAASTVTFVAGSTPKVKIRAFFILDAPGRV